METWFSERRLDKTLFLFIFVAAFTLLRSYREAFSKCTNWTEWANTKRFEKHFNLELLACTACVFSESSRLKEEPDGLAGTSSCHSDGSEESWTPRGAEQPRGVLRVDRRSPGCSVWPGSRLEIKALFYRCHHQVRLWTDSSSSSSIRVCVCSALLPEPLSLKMKMKHQGREKKKPCRMKPGFHIVCPLGSLSTLSSRCMQMISDSQIQISEAFLRRTSTGSFPRRRGCIYSPTLDRSSNLNSCRTALSYCRPHAAWRREPLSGVLN